MKKRKVSAVQILRLLIQIIFFIFLPSIYINIFSSIKQVYLAIIKQNGDFIQLIPQMISVIVIILFTIIMGRFFCGWMCAFGAFGDFIYKISNKLFKTKFEINENTDRVLKYFKYVLLLFLVALIWNFDITVFSTFNPWDVFATLVSVGKIPDFSYAVFNLTAGFILFIFIVIASAFIERFFCRYLCPLGAIFALISKFKIVKIKKERTKCGNCRICTNNCAMGIELYKHDFVDSGECINCMQCIDACPRNNAIFTILGNRIRPLAAAAAAVSIMTVLYYAGGIEVNETGYNNIQTETKSTTAALYKDGTYEGSGVGFKRGTTTVSVVVEDGKITDINTVSYEDDRPFYNKAFNSVTQQIINNQTTDVDTVSGATFSSRGIIEAVEDALSKAK